MPAPAFSTVLLFEACGVLPSHVVGLASCRHPERDHHPSLHIRRSNNGVDTIFSIKRHPITYCTKAGTVPLNTLGNDKEAHTPVEKGYEPKHYGLLL